MGSDETSTMLLTYDPVGLVAGGPCVKVYVTSPGGVPSRDPSVETWALIEHWRHRERYRQDRSPPFEFEGRGKDHNQNCQGVFY